MPRDTSDEAYAYLIESGRLAGLMGQCYDYIFKNGPCTQKQAEVDNDDKNSSLGPCFSKLEDIGLVKPIRHVIDPHTNRKVWEWDVTPRVEPLEPKPKISRAQLIRCLRDVRKLAQDKGQSITRRKIITMIDEVLQ